MENLSSPVPVVVQRNRRRPEPSLPPAQSIQNLRESNPVNPRLQSGIAAKPLNVAKDFKEYFLNRIRSFVGVAQHAVRNMKNRGMVNTNKLVVGRVLIGLEPGDKQCLLGVNDAASIQIVKSYLSAHINRLSRDKVP